MEYTVDGIVFTFTLNPEGQVVTLTCPAAASLIGDQGITFNAPVGIAEAEGTANSLATALGL
jgi:hypothetical protein